MVSLNLQRNSEVFFSTIDLLGGGQNSSMTASNTWKVEILAGFALTQSAATQDITSLESGLNPDRSQQRFNTAINPVDWNFQCYMRPTGVVKANAVPTLASGTTTDGNSKPLADWFLWQSLVSNTRPANGQIVQSVWKDQGKLLTTNVTLNPGEWASRSNFPSATENFMYFKLDNVVYQISNATVAKATVDAGIQEIATTSWSGMGMSIAELTGLPRNNAISVFGGILNNGTIVAANSNASLLSRNSQYHPYNIHNVAGVISTNAFIKNRLSTIEFHHKPTAIAADVAYTFPVTSLSFTYENSISYLIPEELTNLNVPIGQFVGTRNITGSASMYLRQGDTESAGFLRNILNDSRTSSDETSNANLIIGGPIAPFVAFMMPAVQFGFPQLAVEDNMVLNVDFMAQEPTTTRGDGGEIIIQAQKT